MSGISLADFADSPISDNACPFREVAKYLSRRLTS